MEIELTFVKYNTGTESSVIVGVHSMVDGERFHKGNLMMTNEEADDFRRIVAYGTIEILREGGD